MNGTPKPNGLDEIAAMFARARREGRAAFLPYYPAGYPDYETSLDAIAALAAAGADGFEIGLPFSDPLADGPTIQAATQIALENGITVGRGLEALRALRARDVTQPLLLMGYLNPLLSYGLERFARDARSAGAAGVIVPDLPPEEAGPLAEACAREGLALIFFLAPTSSPERIARVVERAQGFIYLHAAAGAWRVCRPRPRPDADAAGARLRYQPGRAGAPIEHAGRWVYRRQRAGPRGAVGCGRGARSRRYLAPCAG